MREPAGREGGERGWDKVRRVVWGMVEERREQRKALGLLGVQLGARLPPSPSRLLLFRGMLVLPPPPHRPLGPWGGAPRPWGNSGPGDGRAQRVLRPSTSAAGRSTRPRRSPAARRGPRTRSGPSALTPLWTDGELC